MSSTTVLEHNHDIYIAVENINNIIIHDNRLATPSEGLRSTPVYVLHHDNLGLNKPRTPYCLGPHISTPYCLYTYVQDIMSKIISL